MAFWKRALHIVNKNSAIKYVIENKHLAKIHSLLQHGCFVGRNLETSWHILALPIRLNQVSIFFFKWVFA